MERQDFTPSTLAQANDGASLWENMRRSDGNPLASSVVIDPEEEARRRKIAQHRAWLASFTHECPSPLKHFKIGVYIRYFNQTKYENYLDYHKQQFIDTIALCPNWTLVGFYVDEGMSPPNMGSAKGWNQLLEDSFAGKVDLILTQKVSNVSRKPEELTFVARLLAAQPHPIGIYFISEDMFTLASYYQEDLHETNYLPKGWTVLPDDIEETCLPRGDADD